MTTTMTEQTTLDDVWPISPKLQTPAQPNNWLAKWVQPVVLATVWLAIPYFIYAVASPWASRTAVSLVPLEWEQPLGESTVAALQKQAEKATHKNLHVWQGNSRQVVVSELNRLAKAAGLKEVFLCDWAISAANAVALPGGHICMTSGMWATVGANGNLAMAVLAHEVAHIERRDGLRMLTSMAMWSLVLREVALEGAEANLAELALNFLVHLPHSREAESATDLRALDLLHAVGRDPHDLPRALELLEALERDRTHEQRKKAMKGEKTDPSHSEWMSTHPNLQERIQRARQAAEKLKPSNGQP